MFDELLIGLWKKAIYMLPYASTQIFGMPIGEYTWGITVLAIIGEGIVMITKKKVK